MIIWVASYPRSGNTYLRQLIYYSLGVKTFSEYNDPLFDHLDMSEAVGHALLPAPIATLAAQPELYLVKTHGLPVDDRPAVYLVRDGRDAVVSHAHFLYSYLWRHNLLGRIKRFVLRPTYAGLLKQVIVGERRLEHMRYGGWSANVLAWTRRAAGHTLVVRYEDLVARPAEALRQVAELAGLQSNPSAPLSVPDFATLHQRWPGFFRKGRSGGWRDDMNAEMESLFWQYHGEGMTALGYN